MAIAEIKISATFSLFSLKKNMATKRGTKK